MPNSKQNNNRTNKTAFYSRKYNKWFKTYDKYKGFDKTSKKQFYYKHAPKLQYNKATGIVYDPVSKRKFIPRKSH